MIPVPFFARTAMAAALLLLAATPAKAAVRDHLQCFRAKDTAQLTALLDLEPAGDAPIAGTANCKVKARSRQVCFPIAIDLSDSSGPTLALSGQALANPFLCYTLKCPAAAPLAGVEMTDFFGTRTLTGLRTSTLCVPAVVGAPPLTTTTLPPGPPRECVDATPPNCDGTCNNYNFACAPDDSGTACMCKSVDVFGGCPMIGGGAPACLGSCSGSLSCIEVSGACQCGLAY
jgi:hypothetical protein